MIEKLKIFEDEIAARNVVAQRYFDALHNIVIAPRVKDGNVSVWAQYTIRLPQGGPSRDAQSRYPVPPGVECGLRSREKKRADLAARPGIAFAVSGGLKASGYQLLRLPATS